MERLHIKHLLDGLVLDITMKYLDGLVWGVIACGCSDPAALENVRQQLPLILDALKKLPCEQQDQVMDKQNVLKFFFNLLKVSGDREIQFFALSILLNTPIILKFGDWMAKFWFPREPVRLEFLKLLQMPQETKVYHDFLDVLNVGDGALVYSWKCSLVIREDDSPGSVPSVETLLSFNFGTSTISFSRMGKDIRLPFSDIECHEIEVENLKGHEMLHLRIETTNKSYSFLGFEHESAASMFMRRGNLSQLLEKENSASHGYGEEEFSDMKPIDELSTFQVVTRKHANPEHMKREPESGNSQDVVKFEHGDPEYIKHMQKCTIIRGVSTQSVPKKVYTNKKSRGLHLIERGNSHTRRITVKRFRRSTVKKSQMSREKAYAIRARRSTRCLNSSEDSR